MYKSHNILSIIPARGGSKGIKLKNLRKINGISLIGHVAKCINKSTIIDKSVVSTDHEGIKIEALNHNLHVPFKRPSFLSGDFVSDLQVLTHALVETEKIDLCQYEYVVMLQPTSPLRTIDIVEAAIKKCVDEKFDSVWSVSKIDLKFHPLKQLTIKNNKLLKLYDQMGSRIVARQQLDTTYYRNGAVYVFSRDCILKVKTILSENSGYIITDIPQISIDTEDDILKVENYIVNI